MADSYAGVAGSRLFVPVNPFRSPGSAPSSSERVNDLYFKNGSVLADSVVLRIPEGYSVEAYGAKIVLVKKL